MNQPRLNKPKVNYLLDWLAYFGFAMLLGTGFLLHWKLPPGSGQAELLGMTRHEWGDVHFWIAIGFLSVVAVHLLMHAKWIGALTTGKARGSRRRLRMGLAVAGCAAGVALVAGVFLLPSAPARERGHGRQATAEQAGTAQADSTQGARGQGFRGGRRAQ